MYILNAVIRHFCMQILKSFYHCLPIVFLISHLSYSLDEPLTFKYQEILPYIFFQVLLMALFFFFFYLEYFDIGKV